jgi:hypothetical protein
VVPGTRPDHELVPLHLDAAQLGELPDIDEVCRFRQALLERGKERHAAREELGLGMGGEQFRSLLHRFRLYVIQCIHQSVLL